ncbi:F-box domain-containing protein [Paramyrothecium foliicola]|nr:F-box domain-containing protein [Paramyrothecium foliicola]
MSFPTAGCLTAMSPILNACNLCGWTVADPDGKVSWLNQFRGLYLNFFSENITLTGVGLYDDPELGSFVVPPNTEARWDDPGYDRPERDEFGAGRRAENDRHGFLFHASCWSILAKIIPPTADSCSKLFEICSSMPRPMGTKCVSWGHNYGGLMEIDNENYFPWEDRESQFPYETSSSIYDFDEDEYENDTSGLGIPASERLPLPDDDKELKEPSLPLAVLKSDPYCVEEILQLLMERPEPPPEMQLQGLYTSRQDDLFKLPKEIRIRIATFLPTTDALQIRLASKSFWHIFYSQHFWASRFVDGGERSWLFELSNVRSGTPKDWRWLYRQTNEAHTTSCHALQNRKRVWNVCKQIEALLELERCSPDPTTSGTSAFEQNWGSFEISSDVRSFCQDAPQLHFYEGCHLLHKAYQDLVSLGSLSQVACSFIQLGDADYLCGLRLIPTCGIPVQLGYRSKREKTIPISVLMGFNVAVGSRGIHAIKCMTDDGELEWCGDPAESPVTKRVAIQKPITALEIGFDGCKVVSISVTEDSLPRSSQACNQGLSNLRESGIWYPSVPGPGLNLNEGSFPQRDFHMTGYRPLVWNHFGGHKGEYLQSLISIAVHVGGGSCPSIDFEYNDPRIPQEYRTLGRHKCDMESPGCEKPWKFSIDGPGGERVNQVEIYLSYLEGDNLIEIYQQGALESFKLFTNRGRSFHFKEEKEASNDPTKWIRHTKKLDIAHGTIITGFYIRQFTEGLDYGISALGVISEVV